MAPYDILGNIALVKFSYETKKAEKQKFAASLLKTHKSVTTVLEKTQKFKGRLRTLRTKWVAGEKTNEVLYRENGCVFRLNMESCYFSPRIANERLSIARLVKKGENVLVLFGGVAPFAIVIAKHSKASRIVSVELGRECSKYALENAKRNGVADRVSIVQGDVRKVLPNLKETFDRIVMARPNLEDSFLDVAFKRVKKGGIIHYYGFYEEARKNELKTLLQDEAKKAGKQIKITKITEAGDIGTRKYRYRADVKVVS